jgi:hypothetical protein
MVILKSYESWFRPKDLSTPHAGALGSLTEYPHCVDLLKGISEASRGGARFAHRMSTLC